MPDVLISLMQIAERVGDPLIYHRLRNHRTRLERAFGFPATRGKNLGESRQMAFSLHEIDEWLASNDINKCLRIVELRSLKENVCRRLKYDGHLYTAIELAQMLHLPVTGIRGAIAYLQDNYNFPDTVHRLCGTQRLYPGPVVDEWLKNNQKALDDISNKPTMREPRRKKVREISVSNSTYHDFFKFVSGGHKETKFRHSNTTPAETKRVVVAHFEDI